MINMTITSSTSGLAAITITDNDSSDVYLEGIVYSESNGRLLYMENSKIVIEKEVYVSNTLSGEVN